MRHLLTHTSGIPDYGPETVDFRKDYTEEELARLAFGLKLEFAPGSRWNYSNTGYVLLGIIVGKASGRFYGDLLAERVFAPLGMKTARVISEADIVPNRAAGYRLVDGQLKNQEWVAPKLNTTADGSLYLSVLDLVAWDRGLRAGAVLEARELGGGPDAGPAEQREDLPVRLRLGRGGDRRPGGAPARRRVAGLQVRDRALPGERPHGRRPRQPRRGGPHAVRRRDRRSPGPASRQARARSDRRHRAEGHGSPARAPGRGRARGSSSPGTSPTSGPGSFPAPPTSSGRLSGASGRRRRCAPSSAGTAVTTASTPTTWTTARSPSAPSSPSPRTARSPGCRCGRGRAGVGGRRATRRPRAGPGPCRGR